MTQHWILSPYANVWEQRNQQKGSKIQWRLDHQVPHKEAEMSLVGSIAHAMQHFQSYS